MNDAAQKNKQRSIPHDSALTHVAGTSEFIDDRPQVRGELIVGLLYAEVPSGILEHIDTQKAQKIEGVVGIYTHKDLHCNIWGSIIHDQPVLVERNIGFFW